VNNDVLFVERRIEVMEAALSLPTPPHPALRADLSPRAGRGGAALRESHAPRNDDCYWSLLLTEMIPIHYSSFRDAPLVGDSRPEAQARNDNYCGSLLRTEVD